MNLGIGTAQFGMDYGISNKDGRTSQTEVASILGYAREAGIGVIDTAHGYGKSEGVLGEALPRAHAFRIVTKTPAFPSRPVKPEDAAELERSFQHSLNKLRQPRLAGLLLHNADDLLAAGGNHLYTKLVELKTRGIVEKIGVSIYSGEQIDALLDRYAIDLIQLPVNALDQRLIVSGRLAELKRRGVEVHARSIFLQGLLLMAPEEAPPSFDRIRPLLSRYHELRSKNGLSPVEAAFCFITGITEIDDVIIGVSHLDQLALNAAAFRRDYSARDRAAMGGFAIDDPQFLNPALWRLNAA